MNEHKLSLKKIRELRTSKEVVLTRNEFIAFYFGERINSFQRISVVDRILKELLAENKVLIDERGVVFPLKTLEEKFGFVLDQFDSSKYFSSETLAYTLPKEVQMFGRYEESELETIARKAEREKYLSDDFSILGKIRWIRELSEDGRTVPEISTITKLTEATVKQYASIARIPLQGVQQIVTYPSKQMLVYLLEDNRSIKEMADELATSIAEISNSLAKYKLKPNPSKPSNTPVKKPFEITKVKIEANPFSEQELGLAFETVEPVFGKNATWKNIAPQPKLEHKVSDLSTTTTSKPHLKKYLAKIDGYIFGSVLEKPNAISDLERSAKQKYFDDLSKKDARPTEKERVAMLRLLANAGMSVPNMALAFNVSEQSIRDYLYKAKISLKKIKKSTQLAQNDEPHKKVAAPQLAQLAKKETIAKIYDYLKEGNLDLAYLAEKTNLTEATVLRHIRYEILPEIQASETAEGSLEAKIVDTFKLIKPKGVGPKIIPPKVRSVDPSSPRYVGSSNRQEDYSKRPPKITVPLKGPSKPPAKRQYQVGKRKAGRPPSLDRLDEDDFEKTFGLVEEDLEKDEELIEKRKYQRKHEPVKIPSRAEAVAGILKLMQARQLAENGSTQIQIKPEEQPKPIPPSSQPPLEKRLTTPTNGASDGSTRKRDANEIYMKFFDTMQIASHQPIKLDVFLAKLDPKTCLEDMTRELHSKQLGTTHLVYNVAGTTVICKSAEKEFADSNDQTRIERSYGALKTANLLAQMGIKTLSWAKMQEEFDKMSLEKRSKVLDSAGQIYLKQELAQFPLAPKKYQTGEHPAIDILLELDQKYLPLMFAFATKIAKHQQRQANRPAHYKKREQPGSNSQVPPAENVDNPDLVHEPAQKSVESNCLGMQDLSRVHHLIFQQYKTADEAAITLGISVPDLRTYLNTTDPRPQKAFAQLEQNRQWVNQGRLVQQRK